MDLNNRIDKVGSFHILSILLCAIAVMFSAAQLSAEESKTPSPQELGKRAAMFTLKPDLGRHYSEACAAYASLLFAQETNDQEIIKKVTDAFAPYLTGEKSASTGHVDSFIFAILPFELYHQSKNKEYLEFAQELADEEYARPLPDGLTRYSRFWIDDLFMVGALQSVAYKYTQTPVYLDRAVNLLLAYAPKLQQPNGLFHHTTVAPFFWGRGNGWAAVGITEMLLAMPTDYPKRAEVLAIYTKLMDAVVKAQHSNGMWLQLLDRSDSWQETSCTAMFVYSLATAVQNKLLTGAAYEQAARKGWNALASFLDEQGRLRDVCTGTQEGFSAQYYLDKQKELGALHGQAAFIWAATAMYRWEKATQQPK